jgi:lipoprotein-anchoring transpeptidase ErfK/SrfK
MKIITPILILSFFTSFNTAKATDFSLDFDKDGLTDYEEINIYHTKPDVVDTDSDGYADGEEIKYGFDPNKLMEDKLEKIIKVNLEDQSLAYFLGQYLIQTFKISSGTAKSPTPKGNFSIIVKKPLVDYKGSNFNYPGTRWNMMFKSGSPGNLYIHGAYWHDKFGNPMSHGCVNVSYADMEALYNWTDVGTIVSIN